MVILMVVARRLGGVWPSYYPLGYPMAGKRFMVHRPSLRVGRKALNFGNLEEQGRKN
jgi:hypothetical protein